MADKKNYYEILGVSKDASDEEIKAAYKKLVKQYHPDLHPGDAAAAEKFKEINEANEVLSDKQKRAAYDYEQAHPGMGGMGGYGAGSGGFGGMGDFGDFFSSMFGFGGRTASRRDDAGEDIQIEMKLSFMDAAKGCVKDLSYLRNEPCAACKGTGAKGGTASKPCSRCGGRGRVQLRQNTLFGAMMTETVCPDCGGRGRIIVEKCPDCRGKGYVRKETTVTLNVPAGVDTNSYITKRGFGQAGSNGRAGDLIVVFRVEPHKLFQRKETDLYLELPVPFQTAALGGKIKVPDVDDLFEFEIPEGTQSGTTFTIRGKGLKTRSGTGNLYLKVFVEIPTKLTREQKKKLEEAAGGTELKQFEKAKKFSDNVSALYGKTPY